MFRIIFTENFDIGLYVFEDIVKSNQKFFENQIPVILEDILLTRNIVVFA